MLQDTLSSFEFYKFIKKKIVHMNVKYFQITIRTICETFLIKVFSLHLVNLKLYHIQTKKLDKCQTFVFSPIFLSFFFMSSKGNLKIT